MAAILNVNHFLHPLDMSARGHLEAVPLLQVAMKKYLSAVHDRRFRQHSSAELSGWSRRSCRICSACFRQSVMRWIARATAVFNIRRSQRIHRGHMRPVIVITICFSKVWPTTISRRCSPMSAGTFWGNIPCTVRWRRLRSYSARLARRRVGLARRWHRRPLCRSERADERDLKTN